MGVAMFGKTKFVLMLIALAAMLQGCGDVAPKPDVSVAKAKAEHCAISDDESEVRKNHMDYLLHKRDQTVHEGIRTKSHSFKECINCHVPKLEGENKLRHTDEKHFCSTCHVYAGVKLDCFQCHTDQPEENATATAVAPHPVEASQ
jgi:hypothetical protein